MPIYADPTELRVNTRLPEAVVCQCVPLPGLEAVTGGDLLITTQRVAAPDGVAFLQGMTLKGLELSPGEAAAKYGWPLPAALAAQSFATACRQGLIVQRKTGRDLASSIPNLTPILCKMLEWTARPWLLFVGTLRRNKTGSAIIDKSDTHFTYNAVQGALEAWQIRGGYVTLLNCDSLVAGWITRWLDKLRITNTQVVLAPPRGAHQVVIGPASDGSDKPWRATLMSFPGMGAELSNRVAENNPTLAGCLEWITCPDWLEGQSLTRPAGIGIPSIRKWRRWLGLPEDYLQLLVAAVPDGTTPKITFSQNNEKETNN